MNYNITMKVQQTIQRENLILPGQTIVVAVSGGADSVATLLEMYALQRQFLYQLAVVNFDHGLRANTSKRDSEFVQALCNRLQIPLYSFTLPVQQRCKENGWTLEQGARMCRLEHYNKLIQDGKCHAVAVCHNLEDNAESIMMHLFRGCGLQGSTGMSYQNEHHLIRPLLDTTRKEVLAYLKEHNQTFVEDETNNDCIYARNFVRHQVLQPAKSRYANVHQNLVHFGTVVGEALQYISQQARGYIKIFDDYATVAIVDPLPSAVQNCAFHLAAKAVHGIMDLTAVHYEQIGALYRKGKNGATLSLCHGLCVQRAFDCLLFFLKQSQVRSAVQVPFQLGETRILHHTILAKECQYPCDEKALYLSQQRLPAHAVWRLAQKDDLFTPFSNVGSKLSKYFRDHKVAQFFRNRLPVLASGNQVLAILNMEIAEQMRVQPNETAIQIITRS